MDLDFIKGIIVPILTPVDDNDLINDEKLKKQVEYVITGGVDGILAFGSNGEFYMLDKEEMEHAFKVIKEQNNKRVPLFFGIGMISTNKCVAMAKLAEKLGADGISVLQPMFLKPTDDELFIHFKTIADAVPNIPMLLYNNPGRTGYTMSGNLVEKLAHEVTNIVGMKDSSGDLTQTEEFIRRNSDVGFKVFGGKDTLVYGALCHGAVGSVCTTANFMPELVIPIYQKFIDGDLKGALAAQFKLNPVRLTMDKGSFPVATKDMANMRGQNVGKPIHPNLETPTNSIAYVLMKDAMQKAGLLQK